MPGAASPCCPSTASRMAAAPAARPVGAPGSIPTRHWCPNGLKDASTDPEQVGRWFRAYPEGDLNVGLVLRDLAAIDEDRPGAILDAGLQLPNGPASKTSRGHHYLFRLNGHALQNGPFAPGLDCKTGSAYIVAPPSLHLSGHRYAWTSGHGLDDLEIPTLPATIEQLILAAHAGGTGNGAAKDDLHDIFGGLKLEAVFLEIERLAPDSGDRWRQLMLRVIRSLVGRGWRDDAILMLCRRATRRDLGFAHGQTDAFVVDEIRRTRHKDKTPEPDEFTQNDDELGKNKSAPPDPSDLCTTPAQWAMRTIPAQDRLLGDLFSTTTRAQLSADTGVGKTMIGVAWSFAMRLGIDFLHWPAYRQANFSTWMARCPLS
jgi:hypothetical protein